MISRLKILLEDNTTKEGRIFDLGVQALIFASLIGYAIDTLPDLSETTRMLLDHLETIIVILFTIEYVLRIAVSERKLGFIFSFYGLIDLLAILPFYLTLASPLIAEAGLDLRILRIVRLMRVVRALKLVRYNRALRLFSQAFQIAKEELALFFLAVVMLLYIAAAGIHFFENEAQPEVFSSLFASLWWAIVTLTTVGYGDVYPITTGGRVFTFFLLMIGLGTIAVPSGIVASALGKARDLQGKPTKSAATGEDPERRADQE
ncbi:MAG: ion transporter [Gammaproteobacteria bacterium]|nr:ion transporter [Gammaproteobacteria bacterium]MDH5344225.1 ion transporter [Gammaproteobacteria bacterium]